MKLTSNINLGGYSFTIDNDAYSMLEHYFESLKTMFYAEGMDDPEDLVNDIELRCAEILNEELAPGEIITINNVRRIMKRMGEPEELAEIRVETHSEKNGSTDTETFTKTVRDIPVPPRVKRRLFRDPKDKLLGGVCSGIAAYLGIDPTWVRLITIVLMFLSFSTVLLVYIILWMIVPEAKTPLQRLQMEGEAPTIENIGKSVNSIFSSNKSDGARNSDHEEYHGNSFTQILINACAILGKVLLVAVGLAASAILLVCVVGLFGAIIGMIASSVGSTTYLSWIETTSGIRLIAGNPILTSACISTALLTLGILIFFLLYGIWRVFFKGELPKSVLTVLGILCGLSAVVSIVCALTGLSAM